MMTRLEKLLQVQEREDRFLVDYICIELAIANNKLEQKKQKKEYDEEQKYYLGLQQATQHILSHLVEFKGYKTLQEYKNTCDKSIKVDLITSVGCTNVYQGPLELVPEQYLNCTVYAKNYDWSFNKYTMYIF